MHSWVPPTLGMLLDSHEVAFPGASGLLSDPEEWIRLLGRSEQDHVKLERRQFANMLLQDMLAKAPLMTHHACRHRMTSLDSRACFWHKLLVQLLQASFASDPDDHCMHSSSGQLLSSDMAYAGPKFAEQMLQQPTSFPVRRQEIHRLQEGIGFDEVRTMLFAARCRA